MIPNIKTPKGYIRLNETSYDKLVDLHLKNGFFILTAFRSEYTLSQNRSRNRELAEDLKSNDLGFIRVTGGYREIIDRDNSNWDNAEIIEDSDNKRLLTIMEESLLVPNYDVRTKQPFENFERIEDVIISLGEKYDQDSVLVSPPFSGGKAYYVITNERYGDVGTVDIQFSKMDLASITDTYFSSLAKTINKLKYKQQDGVGGFKFEKKQYVCTFLDEPRHTLSGLRSENASGALPVFGSHYYESSTLAKKEGMKTNIRKAKNESRSSTFDEIIYSLIELLNDTFRQKGFWRLTDDGNDYLGVIEHDNGVKIELHDEEPTITLVVVYPNNTSKWIGQFNLSQDDIIDIADCMYEYAVVKNPFKLESLTTKKTKNESNLRLKRKANEAYVKLLEVADILYSIHENIDDIKIADDWYDLYSTTKDLANSVADQEL